MLELNGVCGCECTDNPVRPYFVLTIFVIYVFLFRKKIVHFVITAMVVLCVDSVIVTRDGEYACRDNKILLLATYFLMPRVGDTCECDASNISTTSCPYVCSCVVHL